MRRSSVLSLTPLLVFPADILPLPQGPMLQNLLPTYFIKVHKTLVFVLDRPFKPSLMFMDKARGLSYSRGPEKCFIRISSGLSKHWTRLVSLAKDKHPSLLKTFIYYVSKKFYNVKPSSQDLYRKRYNL